MARPFVPRLVFIVLAVVAASASHASAQTPTPLFEPRTVTWSGFWANWSGRFVFAEKTVTVYCSGAGTGSVLTELGGGAYGPPIVDDYITVGSDSTGICSGGPALGGSEVTGTHCFSGTNSAYDSSTRLGLPATTYYFATGITANVSLVDGENSITFKLWDFGSVHANSKLVFAVPSNCQDTPFPVNVGIDIKPGSYPNSVNLCSRGVVTVAILGSADFDVAAIDLEAPLMFASVSPRMVGKAGKLSCNYQDVSGNFSVPDGGADGYLDLVCQYDTLDLDIVAGQSSVSVRGFLSGGSAFQGSDTISIVKDGCVPK